MADDVDIDIGFGADVSRLIKDFDLLRNNTKKVLADLSDFSSKFANNQLKIHDDVIAGTAKSSNQLKELTEKTKSLSEAIAKQKEIVDARGESSSRAAQKELRELDKLEKKYRELIVDEGKLQRLRATQEDRARAAVARGGPSGIRDEAAYQGIVAGLRTTPERLMSRFAEELFKGFAEKIKTVPEQLAARMALETQKAAQRIILARPEVGTATLALQERRALEVQQRVQFGDAAVANQKSRDRFDLHGGADLVAIQARLMANYQILSGLTNTLRYLATFAVDLDKEFKQFQAISATSATEMETLEKRLIGVANATKFTALEVTQAATAMAQAGLSAKEVADSIGAVTLLATAAGTKLSEAVDLVTSTIGIFDLKASETSTVANVMTAALNRSKLTVDKLTLGFQYAGNAAAQAGITYAELTAILGALANSGIQSGSTLGTGLRALLVDLQSPSEKLKATLDRLGLSVQDLNVQSNGFEGVLKRLREAGFTASDGFETLEIRAAAAYAALLNNSDLIGKLREEFLLTNAAIDANAVQMQSLANVWTRFQSTVGTVAYTMMKPFMEAARGVLFVLSDMLSVLNEYPILLQSVGTLIVSLGVAWAAVKIGALVVGFRAMHATMAAMQVQTAASTLMIAGMSTAMTTATVATSRLTVALTLLARHPILILATAVAGLIAGYQLWDAATTTTKERIDALQGSINTIEGQITQYQQTMRSAGETIDRLAKQQAALDTNTAARKATILEVKNAFKELAPQINENTASIADLIEALQKLQNKMAEKLPGEFGAQLAAINLLIQERQKELNGLLGQRRMGLGGAATDFAKAAGYYGPVVSPFMTAETRNRPFQGMIDIIKRELGDEIAKGFELSVRPGPKPPTDPDTIPLSLVRQRRDESQYELNKLETARTLGSLTPEQTNQLRKLQAQVQFLSELANSLEPIVQVVSGIKAEQLRIERIRDESRKTQIQSLPQVQQARTALNHLEPAFNSLLDGMVRGFGGQPTELKARLDNLFNQFDIRLNDTIGGRVEAIEKLLDEATKEAAAKLNIPESEARRLIDTTGIVDKLKTLRSRISAKVTDLEPDLKKILTRELQARESRLRTDVQGKTLDLQRVTSEEQAKLIGDQYDALFKQLQDIDRELFDTRLGDYADKDVIELERAREDRAAKIKEEQRQRAEAVEARIEAIQRDNNDRFVKRLDEQMRTTREEIDRLIATLKKDTPAEAIKIVTDKVNQLNEQLDRWSQMKDATLASGITRNPLGGTPATRNPLETEDREFLLQFLAPGKTKAAIDGLDTTFASSLASLLRRMPEELRKGVMITSGYRDPGEQARIYNEMYAEKMKEAIENGLRGAVADKWVKGQLSGLVATPGNSKHQTGTASDLNMNSMPAAAAEWLRKNAPGNDLVFPHPRDPVHIQFSPAMAAAAREKQVNAQKIADKEYETLTRDVVKRLEGEVKALDARLEGDISRAKIAAAEGSPEGLQKLLGEVDGRIEKIIQARLEVFKKENAKTLDQPETQERLKALERELRDDYQKKVAGLARNMWDALLEQNQKPVKEAQAKLDMMNAPQNVNRFTDTDRAAQELAVRRAEEEAATKDLVVMERELVRVKREREAETKKEVVDTARVSQLTNEQTIATERLAEAKRKLGIYEKSTNTPQLKQKIEEVTRAYFAQAGVVYDNANKVDELATRQKQTAQAYSEMLAGLGSAFSTFFKDAAFGTKSLSESFKAMGLSIVNTMGDIAAKALANEVMLALLGNGSPGSGTGAGGILSMFASLLAPGGGTGMSGGVPGMTQGGIVSGRPTPGRDTQLRRLEPGEGVLKRRVVDILGRDTFHALNSVGERSVAQTLGRTAPAVRREPDTVSVYVVTPDEKPSLGPKDVIATIDQNIMTRGSTRQLIKQVAMGQI